MLAMAKFQIALPTAPRNPEISRENGAPSTALKMTPATPTLTSAPKLQIA